MEIFKGVLLVLHIVGFGAVLGSVIAQLGRVKEGTAKISKGIFHGSLLLLVTGLGLVGMVYALGGQPNNLKIGVKLAVLVVIFALAMINKNKERVSGGVLGAIAGLSVVNVALAVLW